MSSIVLLTSCASVTASVVTSVVSVSASFTATSISVISTSSSSISSSCFSTATSCSLCFFPDFLSSLSLLSSFTTTREMPITTHTIINSHRATIIPSLPSLLFLRSLFINCSPYSSSFISKYLSNPFIIPSTIRFW